MVHGVPPPIMKHKIYNLSLKIKFMNRVYMSFNPSKHRYIIYIVLRFTNLPTEDFRKICCFCKFETWRLSSAIEDVWTPLLSMWFTIL